MRVSFLSPLLRVVPRMADVGELEDITGMAQEAANRASKKAEALLPENVRKDIQVKSNSVKERYRRCLEKYPFLVLVKAAVTAIVTFGLFFLDFITDMNAINEVGGTNATWQAVMLFFVLLPFFVSMVGISIYTYKRSGWKYTVLLLPFLPVLQPLLDISLPFVQLLGRCNLLSEDANAFIVSYSSVRTLSESFLESFPQTVFQIYIFLYCKSNGCGENSAAADEALAMSISVSFLSILWHGLGTYLASRAMGVTYREYLSTLVKMGGGLPLEAVRRNRAQTVKVAFKPDLTQFDHLMAMLPKNTSVMLLDFSEAAFEVDEINVVVRYMAEGGFGVQRLDLSGNRELGPAGFEALGNGLMNNTSIQDLNLQNTNLDGASLRKFFNRMTEGNTTLKTIHLESNRLAADAAQAIGAALARTTGIERLHMGENCVGSAGAQHIMAALAGNTTLLHLELHHNDLDAACGQYIADALVANTTLNTLDLSFNVIGDDGIVSVAGALRTNRTLATMLLHENGIALKGSEALATALLSNRSLMGLTITEPLLPIQSLRGIDVVDEVRNFEGDQATDAVILDRKGIGHFDMVIVAELFKQNTRARVLNLERNRLGVEGTECLGKALAVNQTLTEVNIASNDINPSGIKYISGALKTNTTLRVVDLSTNEIGAEGAKVLAEGLAASKLEHLSLEKNKLGEKGIVALEAALLAHPTLKRLDLLGNHLGEGGGKVIANILGNNTCLEELNVRFNKLGANVPLICEALKTNSTLHTLVLGKNEIDDETAEVVAEMIAVNTGLLHLDLQNNSIENEGFAKLGLALKKNNSLEELNFKFNHIGYTGCIALAEGLKVNTSVKVVVLQDNFLDDTAMIALENATSEVEFIF